MSLTEPPIRYARAEDGVNIAYYTLGSGPAFVWLSLPMTHLLAEWRVPEFRAALEGTARSMTLVRLDPRGFGLSDRDVPDLSFDGMVKDIEAVLQKEGLGPVVMMGAALASFVATSYAATHPKMVSRLILFDPVRQGLERSGGRLDALAGLATLDWKFASETMIRSFWDVGDEGVRSRAEILRESVNYEELRTLTDRESAHDFSQVYESLQMPTLVLHDRSDNNVSAESSRKAAALIPDVRFVEIAGVFEAPGPIARFLAETGGLRPHAPLPDGTTVILFADIADSTGLTERLGDAAFRAKARDLDTAMRAAIRASNGTPVEGKLLGDGVLAVFTAARDAITAAVRCRDASTNAGLELHLGIHAGDVIREENNVFGGAVNIAARISAASAPGEVLVSETVRSLARTSAGVTFEDRGEQALKGIAEPVRVWAVRERGE